MGYHPKIGKIAKIVLINKGGRTNVDRFKQFRPICICSTLGKALECLEVQLLQKYEAEIPSGSRLKIDLENAHGYKKGGSTATAVESLRALTEEGKKKNMFMAGVSIDMSNAFNLIKHSCVGQAIGEFSPSPVVNLLCDYLYGREIYYENGQEGKEGEIHFTNYAYGTPQGG
ncbi:conserved hypothetical protein, partial [Perkinsus marinus ATCC 50983]